MPGILNLIGSNALETGKGMFRYDFHFTDNQKYDNIVYSVHSESDIDLNSEWWKEVFQISISMDLAEGIGGNNNKNKYTLLFVEKVILSEIISLTKEQREESENIIQNNVEHWKTKLR